MIIYVMDFTNKNEIDREFYKKDFSKINLLIKDIRDCLSNNTLLDENKYDLSDILTFNKFETFVYITLFQSGVHSIRWGTNRDSFISSLNRCIKILQDNEKFNNFDIANPDKCRIMLEYVTSCDEVDVKKLTQENFTSNRVEPGITGMKLVYKDKTYYYMPTDAWVNSQMSLKRMLNSLIRKTPIKDMTNKISERIKILYRSEHKFYLLKSRCFISYKDDILPLYRGNVLYQYSSNEIKEQAINGADWIVNYQQSDGKYTYYYDAKEDNYVDHEHPDRPIDDLYYNDLRHCGGIVTLLRAYQVIPDEKYLLSAKKGIEYISTLTKIHKFEDGTDAGYVFLNKKAKLGGTGIALVSFMRYRMVTNDKSFDKYIVMYVKHLLSRIYKTGEFLGYYIHPSFQNGQPLLDMTDEERKNTFSFYYPGEALLGLALFANYFDGEDDLKNLVLKKSKIALDWIVDERPKIYAEMFTSLPADAWLMQAIEEWANNTDFCCENYTNFVINDAKTMMSKMYKDNDSPFIDYDGAFYYNYGDVAYPDGSRSEGLIAAYYLAKKLNLDIKDDILNACRKTALSQMYLFNSDKNNYAHKNPSKSQGSIRFKTTRQWIRVDSIQHVACFFIRLFLAENL